MTGAAVAGSGPDLVLLHGWGTNAHVWRQLASLLSARYRVHLPSLEWEWREPGDTTALERMADRLSACVPRHCAVCGWSLGGLVAMTWALRAPEQVARVALIGTSPCFVKRPGWPHALEPESLSDFARELTRGPSAVITRYIALQARGDARATRVARHLRRTLDTATDGADPLALRRGLALLGNTDSRSVVTRLAQPALIIHGAADAVVPLAAGERLAAALPNARISIYSGAGHAPFVSHAEDVSAELARFFDAR